VLVAHVTISRRKGKLVTAPAASDRKARSDYRCADCGYGIVTAEPPAGCPMCGGGVWDHASWRPFSDGADKVLRPLFFAVVETSVPSD
jgi:hypothetical protein